MSELRTAGDRPPLLRLEGVTRNACTHAAGVIITEHPLTTYAPVQKDIGGGNKNLIQSQL